MTRKELLDMISEGESTTVEFKRKATTPQKLAREISAFANTKGGWLLIGVDDNGAIVGVRSEKSEIDIVEKACEFNIDPPIQPIIQIIAVNDFDIIIIKIEQSKSKPHKVSLIDAEEGKEIHKAFIRLGEKSMPASREMTRLMTYQTEGKPITLSIGEKEKRLFTYLENYEKATVKDFAKLVNISDRRAERLLIRLVRAGVLQLHNDETRDFFTLN